jgi:hypothetical protein
MIFRVGGLRALLVIGIVGGLAGCGDSRAVLLPLQYPDGTPVQTEAGDAVMAGYQTYGSPVHANATALYENAAPTSCVTCARVVGIVSEPSVLRQATGLLGASTVGAGAVMGGLGVMNYGNAAEEGKLGTNVTQEVTQSGRQDEHIHFSDRQISRNDNDYSDKFGRYDAY